MASWQPIRLQGHDQATDEEDKALATDPVWWEGNSRTSDVGRSWGVPGRISETASVQVTKYMEEVGALPLRHAFDQRGQGTFASELTAMDVLKATPSSWNSFRSTKDSGHEIDEELDEAAHEKRTKTRCA